MSIIKNYLKQNKTTHTFSSCQWPIGDPQEKDFHFCEAINVVGKPYCQEHASANSLIDASNNLIFNERLS